MAAPQLNKTESNDFVIVTLLKQFGLISKERNVIETGCSKAFIKTIGLHH